MTENTQMRREIKDADISPSLTISKYITSWLSSHFNSEHPYPRRDDAWSSWFKDLLIALIKSIY